LTKIYFSNYFIEKVWAKIIEIIFSTEKQEYNGMKDLLSSVAHQELADLPPMIMSCTVNYVPEMGYMLAVPLWADDLGEDDVQLHNVQLLVITIYIR
jgi:hypothetical protein